MNLILREKLRKQISPLTSLELIFAFLKEILEEIFLEPDNSLMIFSLKLLFKFIFLILIESDIIFLSEKKTF